MQYKTIHQFHNDDLHKANAMCIRVVEERERKRNIADIKHCSPASKKLTREQCFS